MSGAWLRHSWRATYMARYVVSCHALVLYNIETPPSEPVTGLKRTILVRCGRSASFLVSFERFIDRTRRYFPKVSLEMLEHTMLRSALICLTVALVIGVRCTPSGAC